MIKLHPMKRKNGIFTILLLLSSGGGYAQWSVVCGTGNGFVDNFEVFNNTLYATGFFTNLCDSSVSHLAAFDESSGTWLPLGNGHNHAGHQLKDVNNHLYFAAYQPNIDSNWVYEWDGSNLNKVGEGVYLTNAVTGFSQTANIYALQAYNGNLIASGEFDRVGTRDISGVMQWDGTKWDSLSSGLSGNIAGTAPIMYPHDMCLFGNDLIVAGNFLKAGGITVNGIARWDGNQWFSLGAGFNGVVYGVCEFNGELYAGGDFTMSGTTPLTYIAKWDGNSWVDPGFRMYYQNASYYSFIHTLKVLNNRLYISGGFDRVESGSQVYQCQAICAYDGSIVDTLGGGLPGKEIEGITWYNGALYAGGGINNSNSYVARYSYTAGVQESVESTWTISPNPSENRKVVLSSDKPLGTIQVYNALGQVITVTDTNETTYELNFSSPGIFWITRISGVTVNSKKIVVK